MLLLDKARRNCAAFASLCMFILFIYVLYLLSVVAKSYQSIGVLSAINKYNEHEDARFEIKKEVNNFISLQDFCC